MDLLRFNIWLDVAFPLIWEATAIFLAIHFALSIVTGRAKKTFIEGKWPQHDSAPPPLPKFLHAQHMFMMVILAVTGMYIRFPWFANGRPVMRGLHYFAMIVVSVTLFWRIWYAFYSKNRDWKEFRIQKKDAVTLGGVLKYYGYLSNNKPHVAKYNVAQKGSYMLFLVMMVVQMLTGFALLNQPWPVVSVSPRDVLVGWWLGGVVGSTELAGWYARTVHYILTWGFIIMVTVHVYLSATVDIPCTLDFFGLKKLPVKPHAPEPAPTPEPIGVVPASSD